MSETETSQVVTPVCREIVVGCDPQRAFDVFTADMTSWWPATHHIGSTPIAEVIVEPHPGGRWYTRHEDGAETHTGFVVRWDRPETGADPGRLIVTWQVGVDWAFHPDLVTTVEVRFTPDTPGHTRVALEHRDLENFGEQAQQMKAIFEAPDAWQGTLESFASVAEASA